MKNISIIMRSCNDAGFIDDTLRMVYSQTIKEFELINIDNESTDGTLDIISRYNKDGKILTVKRGDYMPGTVLNYATENASGDIVVFLNSDATPVDERWLESLVSGLDEKAGVVTAYSRQVARAEANLLVKMDYERAYCPQGGKNAMSEMMFSFASVALYKKIWKQYRFYEAGLSEDMEWCSRIVRGGFKYDYIPGSAVYHSHNYTIRELFRKTYLENVPFGGLCCNRVHFLVLLKRCIGSIFRDFVGCVRVHDIGALTYSPFYRATIFMAAYLGMKEGSRLYVKQQAR